jgi:predicted nucleotidyltransferase
MWTRCRDERRGVPVSTLRKNELLAVLRRHKPLSGGRYGVPNLGVLDSVARDEAETGSDLRMSSG